jgi:hypothetical protein
MGIRPARALRLVGVDPTDVPLAMATGYYGIAADRHDLTDVLAGATVGIAVGYTVPALHGGRSAKRLAIVASAGAHGGRVLATWVW